MLHRVLRRPPRRLPVTAVAGLLLLAVSAAPSAGADLLKVDENFKNPGSSFPPKIGTIDMRKVAKESAPGLAAAKQIKDRYQALKAKMDEREKKLEKLRNVVEGKVKGKELTPQQREAKVRELQKGLKEYRDQAEKYEKEMRAEEDAVTKKVMDKVRSTVEEYGKANGYKIIVDEMGVIFTETGVSAIDVTPEIISRLAK